MRNTDSSSTRLLRDLNLIEEYSPRVFVSRSESVSHVEETPWHQHQSGQLVLPLTGVVTCFIEDKMWLVPPRCAVWIPSMVSHSNQISANADVCMLLVAQAELTMPDYACTLTVTPLLRELVIHLATQTLDYEPGSATDRLVTVLLDQLVALEREEFAFPIPEHPVLKRLAFALLAKPNEKRTLKGWANDFAMSERTLARMIKRHVQLTFGQWRAHLHIVLALQKLAHGTPVQTISEELGYESVSAFITFFKKALGKSPRQYRLERWGF
ncbi:AraC family transcriptional regulator [Marinomonas pollencensis]|uniref:AraC family transcriptional regulator n=1 Tax=Marinomonas pollencensis TaxID=491954 RepID=A0A3E0DP07_9GAMM|nr:helix-turn-helix transcriptional regulator [Marinomonas pollencensis]REG83936.1 AraC family transcriptional regulator [Marinomonas pollencensis]